MIWQLTRRSLSGLVILASLLPFISSPARANDFIDSYTARLSITDHFNTEGVRLDSAAAIIRQDRAHFHRFNIRDREDTYDSVFGDIRNRETLEQRLNNGNMSESVRQTIVDGTPLIRVDIYQNSIDLFIID